MKNSFNKKYPLIYGTLYFLNFYMPEEKNIIKKFKYKYVNTEGIIASENFNRPIDWSDVEQFLLTELKAVRQQVIKETINHISFKEGWEETGDKYRKEFGIKPKYVK